MLYIGRCVRAARCVWLCACLCERVWRRCERVLRSCFLHLGRGFRSSPVARSVQSAHERIRMWSSGTWRVAFDTLLKSDDKAPCEGVYAFTELPYTVPLYPRRPGSRIRDRTAIIADTRARYPTGAVPSRASEPCPGRAQGGLSARGYSRPAGALLATSASATRMPSTAAETMPPAYPAPSPAG